MARKENAESLRLGLALGLVHVEEVIAWADSELLNSDEPGFEIIEIAASFDGNTDRIISLLKKVPGRFDELAVLQNVFSFMRRKVKIQPDSAFKLAQMLYSLRREFETELPESILSGIYQIDDSFELAIGGQWGSVDEAKENLIIFLENNGSSLDWLSETYNQS